jgi:hypothetical protein
MKIIALCGPVGSGKDSCCENISAEFKLAFAKPLKDSIKILFDFSHDQLYDPISKETVDERFMVTPREVMQKVGDSLRSIDKNFFINRLSIEIEKMSLKKSPYVIITDVRYPNEAEFIKSIGGSIVRIKRPHSSVKRTKFSDHKSEIDLDEKYIDLTIINDKTLEDLKKQFNDILKN